jgi:CheY-like chemotaxis protein
LRTGFERSRRGRCANLARGTLSFYLRTVPGLLQELAVNSENNLPLTPSKTVSKESVGKATSELNNLLQIISGTSAEIANMSEGKEGSAQYFNMLRSSISRAEAVAAELAEEAGAPDQKVLMQPELNVVMKPKTVTEIPRPGQSILVVDDEQMALVLIKRLLTDAGFHAVTAQSGFEALDLFRRQPQSFQLVLLDLTMPFMDGEETFQRLREIREDVPVFLCTGFIQRDRLDRMMTAGIKGFLRKPIAPDELIDHVRRVLASLKYAHGAIDEPSLVG